MFCSHIYYTILITVVNVMFDDDVAADLRTSRRKVLYMRAYICILPTR